MIVARNLEGKVAVITGGGGAIGSATAERLARAGAIVAVADLRREAAVATAEDLKTQGLLAEAFEFDLGNESDCQRLIGDVVQTFGRIDILHNNAHVGNYLLGGADRNVLDMDVNTWDRVFAVNVRGAMILSREAIPHMLKTGSGGAIVNTSSGASETPAPDGRTAYGSSKGALETLTRYIAAQCGANNIRCNAILPGAVLTPGMQAQFSPEQLDELVSRTMLQRITLPSDIAATVHFLVSEDARQITGQLIRVDAGRL